MTHDVSTITVDHRHELKRHARIVITCGDYEISIITGPDTYSSAGHPFEIAVFDEEGNFIRDFFPSDHEDDILGHQTWHDVSDLIKKIEEVS